MAYRKDIPKSVIKLLTERGMKIWRKDLAAIVKEPMLPHYAMACNALAEYNSIKDEISELEAKGENVRWTKNDNGTMSAHPLQALLEKARRAFGDEAKRCDLTKDMIANTEAESDDILAS